MPDLTFPVEHRERFGTAWQKLERAMEALYRLEKAARGPVNGQALYDAYVDIERHSEGMIVAVQQLMDFMLDQERHKPTPSGACESTRQIDRIVAEHRKMLERMPRHDAREWLLGQLLCSCTTTELAAWLDDHDKLVPTIAPRSRLQRLVLNHIWPEEEHRG